MSIRLKTYADISESALLHNYNKIKEHVRKYTLAAPPQVICVVKADAYGHGVDLVSQILGDAGCGYFAVSSEEEAVELRELEAARGRNPEILILGYTFPENAHEMAELGVTCTAVSYEHALLLAEASKKSGSKLKVHIKLDTGMNRVGFSTLDDDIEATVREIAELKTNKDLEICGIFTHFACADDELLDGKSSTMTASQLRRFRNVLDRLDELGINPGMRHCANSAAVLAYPEAYFDAVRAGIILYGMFPNGEVNGVLRPVMKFASTIGHIHRMHKGESVSYGAVYTAEHDMTIATVTAGYADGYIRRYTGAEITVNGKRFRQVGRICMDQCMIDITGYEDFVHPGDEAVLFGGDNGEALECLAKRAGTINYECTCIISKRVVRKKRI